MFIDRRMDKEDVAYIYIMLYILQWNIYTYITMEYYSAIKKNEILPFETTWIDLEGIMLSEISQTKSNTV